MRTPVVFGNWKMNMLRQSACDLAAGVIAGARELQGVEVGICPPAVYLEAVGYAVRGTPVFLGAQNVHWEARGAFTGELAPGMLKDVGCTHVVVGHSERRHLLGESDEMINRKLRASLTIGLTPIFCLGELLEHREAGETEKVLERQLEGGLTELTGEELGRLIVAYEPVWAIGTGKTATPAQAQQAHAYLRGCLRERFGDSIATAVRIQYGGSVKPENAGELAAQPDVDGALVGGASLESEAFVAICRAAAESSRASAV